jgi:hypothetical protein
LCYQAYLSASIRPESFVEKFEPIGNSLPKITFAFRSESSSIAHFNELSTNTLTVSWNEAAAKNQSHSFAV